MEEDINWQVNQELRLGVVETDLKKIQHNSEQSKSQDNKNINSNDNV